MLFFIVQMAAPSPRSEAEEREPVTLKVITVNPSTDKTQTTPVRIDLPTEVTPADVLEKGELKLEYDEEKGSYYVFSENVQLAPKETRVFEVTFKDVWFIPDAQLQSLKDYTGVVVGRLQKTEYAESAQELGGTITKRLDEIAAMQHDETLSRKSRIGSYRVNLQTVERVKEDLARLEKLLTFTGGPPVPEMLEESPLKSDAPSATTTWLVIFLVVIFIGLLGGQFFFTWQRRSQVGQDLVVMRQTAFGAKPANGAHPEGAGRNGSGQAAPGSRPKS